MTVHELSEIPTWEWPEDGPDVLRAALTDRNAPPKERRLAASLAGEIDVLDDDLARTLVALASDRDEPADLRAGAAIALGPALEYVDILDPDEMASEEAFSAETIARAEASLQALYEAPDTPDVLKRAALEASVRAPREWHEAAVRAALAANDPAWRLTAVFCLRFVDGFAPAILEALSSGDPNLHYQAVCAAGEQELDEAWPDVAALLEKPTPDRDLLMAAIEAAARIRPDEAIDLIDPFTDADDEDVAEVALDALAMARAFAGELDEDEDEEDE